MTENKAFVIDAVVGTLLSCGAVVLADALGLNDGLQALIGVWGLVITCFMVGVIGEHYRHKAEGEGKDPDERFR